MRQFLDFVCLCADCGTPLAIEFASIEEVNRGHTIDGYRVVNGIKVHHCPVCYKKKLGPAIALANALAEIASNNKEGEAQ